jgi:hypothetical protein
MVANVFVYTVIHIRQLVTYLIYVPTIMVAVVIDRQQFLMLRL